MGDNWIQRKCSGAIFRMAAQGRPEMRVGVTASERTLYLLSCDIM
jgi:hypothetical protein